jgi:hypothetical protein
MAAKLSRRKYAVATKALNQIIGRENTPVDKKLRAIELLFNLHERHDKMQARAEAQARKEAGLPDEPVDEETTVEKAPELSAEDIERTRINEVLGWVPKGDSQR